MNRHFDVSKERKYRVLFNSTRGQTAKSRSSKASEVPKEEQGGASFKREETGEN
jgi:hypothetical protein